jgi:amino acid permease
MAGEVISLAGSLGTLISYGWASTIVGSFMLCLNEMLSFRYEVGAIFEYPTKFVGPAFGFAVAYIYL